MVSPYCVVVTPGSLRANGYWALSWYEVGQRRQTTAGRTWAAAYADLCQIEQRLNAETGLLPTRRATDWLDWWVTDERVGRTLDAARTAWSENYQRKTKRLLDLYLRPVLGRATCEELTAATFQRAVDKAVAASTYDTAARVRKRIRKAVADGWQEQWFVARPEDLTGRL
jgi:hypothetical protein